MKKFITIALAATGTFLLSGMDLPLYPAAKKNTPVIQAAFENNGDFYRLAFKLAPGTGNDFSINSVYVFTDNDRNTGRKGIGNEYFLDVKKAMVSTYNADGKGKLHRKALSTVRSGQWYFLKFSSGLNPENPLKDFEIVFNVNNKSDRVIFRGDSPAKDDVPADKQ